jgi:hypothetical protein
VVVALALAVVVVLLLLLLLTNGGGGCGWGSLMPTQCSVCMRTIHVAARYQVATVAHVIQTPRPLR